MTDYGKLSRSVLWDWLVRLEEAARNGDATDADFVHIRAIRDELERRES